MGTTEKPIFEFRRSLFIENPMKFFQAIIFLGGSFFLVDIIFGRHYAILSLFLSFLSLPEIFFPFIYKIYNDKIHVNRFFYKINKDLSYYRKVYKDRNGVFLSPYRNKSRMENFRGVLLRIPAEDREEVYSFLKERIERIEEEN
ncbi:MAG: hypothetical protein CR982_03015 [Candidatus Cloacimonadota bacterium]|nr:MAG: hypothetical protein CR982_03015 [Candidatus Cloacimonadota bacterium]PIE82035.1 MAG: hypothetical protein CSA15_00205 [Candidatus Delongbacteria bacterium]